MLPSLLPLSSISIHLEKYKFKRFLQCIKNGVCGINFHQFFNMVPININSCIPQVMECRTINNGENHSINFFYYIIVCCSRPNRFYLGNEGIDC